MGTTLTVILASASPRRRALLEEAGLTFEVRPAGVDESIHGEVAPEVAARTLALRKAQAVYDGLDGASHLVLGSDTIVAIGEGPGARQLGKPADAHEAREMLTALAGTRHQVVTGVAVLRSPDGAEALGHERTWVTMRSLTESEIQAYVDTGEWQDKAGGYAIQETADRFVTRLEGGGWDTVVGLPLGLVSELFTSLGGPRLADPHATR